MFVFCVMSTDPGDGNQGNQGDQEGIAGAVRAMLESTLTALGRAGRQSAAGVADAVEAPCRSLARRSTEAALASPEPVTRRADLAEALAHRAGAPALGGATAAALAARVARRVGPLRFLARRTPLWLAAAALPALHASVTRGAAELSLLSSFLVHKARAAGIDPDPERVRRAAVQVLSGSPVDAGSEPRHGPLAVAWLQRALRATLPFADGVTTRDPQRLAAAADAVDPSVLGATARPGLPAAGPDDAPRR